MKDHDLMRFASSDRHKADKAWRTLGGDIAPIRRTGEFRYAHAHFERPLTVGRRKDTPRALICRIKQLQHIRTEP